MSPLEQLFCLEIEFHRRVRTQSSGSGEVVSLHTNYAVQSGYEPLLGSLGSITTGDVESIRERLTLSADARDLLAARDSLKQLLGIRLIEP
jgi:hypothetical protein